MGDGADPVCLEGIVIDCLNKHVAHVCTMQGHSSSVNSISFSPSGTLLATGSRDGTARLWDVTTGKQVCVIKVGNI
jgi:WD40 repeat protein